MLDSLELNASTVKSFSSWFHKSNNNDTIGRENQHRLAMVATSVAQQRMLAEFPKGPSPLFSPSYAAGEVFVDGVLDTLLCQSFFNPYVIDLVRAISGDYYYSDHHSHSTPQTFLSSMMEYFEHSSHGPTPAPKAVTPPAKRGRVGETKAPDMDHPVLATATIAAELEGQSFATIFAKALAQDVLVLAIFRRPNDPRRGNALPYIYTCPKTSGDVLVEHGDTLHVLTRHPQPLCIRS